MSQFSACFRAKEANSRLSTANRMAKWKRKLVGAATHQRTRLNRLFAPSAGMNAKLVKRANCIYREGERVSDTCKRNTSAKTQIRSCSYGPAYQFQYVANYNNCRDPAEELTHTHLGSCWQGQEHGPQQDAATPSASRHWQHSSPAAERGGN